MQPFSVIALLTQNNLILAVSRKDNPNKYSIVGGKIDSDETPEQAVKCEVKEETGLDILEMFACFEDFDLVEKTSDSKLCRCYKVTKWSGEISTTESGIVKWVEPKILIDPEFCPFSDYNKKLFQTLNIK